MKHNRNSSVNIVFRQLVVDESFATGHKENCINMAKTINPPLYFTVNHLIGAL